MYFKNKFLVLYTALSIAMAFGLQAQENPKHVKKSYVDSLNRFYTQAEMPLYLYVSNSPDQTPMQLPLPQNTGNKEIQPIYLDGHGTHYLRHKDALHHKEDKFIIYADGIAPVSRSTFSNATSFTSKGKQFYGKGLSIQLATKDEMSGIENLYYTLNQENYQAYKQILKPENEGEYNLSFYAVDHVGNVEKPKKASFTVDLSAPKSYHNIVGISEEQIISSSTKIYLTTEDSISGVKQTYYYFDDQAERLYVQKTSLPVTQLNDGDHTLTYYSIDQVGNKEEKKSISFYLDKSSPIMSADVLGDRFIVDDKVYFSGRTKLKLTAVDNKAGIKNVMYAVDNQKYNEYKDPFYLPKESGLHTIRYYAVDNMGNQGVDGKQQKTYDEYKHNSGQVYVDLTGPVLSHQYVGKSFQKGDSLYIHPGTQIQLKAFDPESGLQKITYNLDQSNEEITFEQPFVIAEEGMHTINYFGYDNVNNRNIKDFTLHVDNKGPEIFTNFSNALNQESSAYPSYVALYLAATDLNTTISAIYYSINEGAESLYGKPIRGFKKNKNYRIKVRAVDILGNQTQQIHFHSRQMIINSTELCVVIYLVH